MGPDDKVSASAGKVAWQAPSQRVAGNQARPVQGGKAAEGATTRFSAALEPVIDWLRRDARRTVVLAGLETHICLTQTALDLIEADFAVAVVVDACSAGGRVDHEAALARLTAAGALPLTTEAALFEWMGDSSHPAFREISARVRQQREAPARPVG